MKEYDYEKFVKYYDYLDGDFIPYKEVTEKLDNIFKKYGKKILDMACGTGNFTIELKKLEYDIEGADISKGMLEIARKKAPDVKFFRKDMRDKINKKYDIIICMFNAIGHLDKEELEKVLKNFYQSTKSLIVFDIFNFDFMTKNWIKGEFIDSMCEIDDTKIVRFSNNTLDKKNKIMNINQITNIQKKMDLKKYKSSWQMKIYTLDEIEDLLKKTGFKIKYLFGEFSKEEGLKKFLPDSKSVIVVAEKNV